MYNEKVCDVLVQFNCYQQRVDVNEWMWRPPFILAYYTCNICTQLICSLAHLFPENWLSTNLLLSLPKAMDWSWRSHSPPWSQIGQSRGWFTRRNSITPSLQTESTCRKHFFFTCTLGRESTIESFIPLKMCLHVHVQYYVYCVSILVVHVVHQDNSHVQCIPVHYCASTLYYCVVSFLPCFSGHLWVCLDPPSCHDRHSTCRNWLYGQRDICTHLNIHSNRVHVHAIGMRLMHACVW